MSKTIPPIASPNRLPKRCFTPVSVSFMVGVEWIFHERWGIWGAIQEKSVSGTAEKWKSITSPP